MNSDFTLNNTMQSSNNDGQVSDGANDEAKGLQVPIPDSLEIVLFCVPVLVLISLLGRAIIY